MNERQLFESALEIPDPQARQAFLDDACRVNADLRARVEALLKSHVTAGSFLDIPAADQMGQDVDNVSTNTIVVDPAADQDADREPAEAEFRKYLQPATRAGWLGRMGHYEIEAILGRGAFGIVAKAFDEKLHRVVAIKLLNPELAATSPPRKRFLREARTAAAVTHENIVAIHAVEEDPIPYLVMEFVPGQTLQQRMDQQGPLEIQEILRIGQQVAAGLAAAHAVNLIHRDIKPSNILLTGGPQDRAKISDFGLARAVDDATLTSSGLIAGTPMYMAPEQARGDTLDHRADLFSLGSVLYQMASGRPPFRAANTVAVLKRVCEDTPRPLDDVIPGIPGWLETIIFRLLEKDRDARYQSAREVADLMARCQSELQHQGRVTCVPGHTAHAAETQDLPARQGNRAVPDRRTIGWWGGGAVVLVVLAVIAVLNIAPGGSHEAAKQASSNADKSPTASATNEKGWHGWPADAPKPAITPFDAAQAKKHQEAWAKYLKVPVEYTNSIGMKFMLIPPGEFLMGSTQAEILSTLAVIDRNNKHLEDCVQSEGPRHRVTLTRPFYLGTTEVSQSQFLKVMGRNPAYFASSGGTKELAERVANLDTGDFPVDGVSRVDAIEFCENLREREKLSTNPDGTTDAASSQPELSYRLPSEAEWELACRAGTTSKTWTGDISEELARGAWFINNSALRTHRTGELAQSPFGLYDIHGNVWEWVGDNWDPAAYGRRAESSVKDPIVSDKSLSKGVVRGGAWSSRDADCRSSSRLALEETYRNDFFGFRVALSVEAVQRQLKSGPEWNNPVQGWHGWPADAPKAAIAPFNAEQAKKHQEEWAAYLKVPVEYTNTIGMKFRLIPPGEFMMGSTLAEIAAALPIAGDDRLWQDCIKSEGPRHKVILTQPTYLCVTEVTQSQYTQVMEKNPSYYAASGKWSEYVTGFDTSTFPVEGVTWDDATEFCGRLVATERLEPGVDANRTFSSPFGDAAYRLPSEVEWGIRMSCRDGESISHRKHKQRSFTSGMVCRHVQQKDARSWRSAEKPLWLLRHARQCLGMDSGYLESSVVLNTYEQSRSQSVQSSCGRFRTNDPRRKLQFKRILLSVGIPLLRGFGLQRHFNRLPRRSVC